jgi:UDP-GlcNAc:undecaprenyl-phosphate GlcNAc-1-phosphate transferase
MAIDLAVALATALLATVVLVPPVRLAAIKLGMVVPPGGRHAHSVPTPTAGGVAVFLAVWLGVTVGTSALGLWPWSAQLRGIFLGSLLLLLLCVTDDAWGLPVLPRLLGQILVALIAWEHHVRIVGLSHPVYVHGAGIVPIGWLSLPLTVIWIVFFINAVNWLDGLDGLASGVIGIAALTLAVMALTGVHGPLMLATGLMAAALAAGCGGFLCYNFNPARIFMGDSGSMFLGYMIACVSVLGAYKVPTLMALAAPVLVLGVPIYEAVSTVVRRTLHHQPIYSADRGHLHHRLLDRGLSVRQTVLAIYALTAALCLLALWLWFR